MHAFLLALPLLQLASGLEYTPIDASSLSKDSFFDQFLASNLHESGWIPSKAVKLDGSPYKGKWEIREPRKYPVFSGEKGLEMVSEANFFSISKRLPFTLLTNGQDLVLQYEVKFQNGVTCGGAYLKLLSNTDPNTFSDASRYEIMFGPDICGSENRVHLLMKRKTTEENEDSKLRTPPMAKTGSLSTLYTLIIKKNMDMEIRINGGVAKAGNMLNTPNLMIPSITVPEYIPDVSAQKPETWDDRQFLVDESVEKPVDYDELYNSKWVADPNVKKPDGWNDDESEPARVPDPEATRPQEWNDEEDGEWRAPLVANPKCRFGCGKWEAPLVVNPDYKGEWVAPAIKNPNYKGEWKRPLVANPEYGKDSNVGIRSIDGIGIDVWSMQSGVIFSNIYLGHSVAEAEKIGNETFIVKWDVEFDNYTKTRPRARYEPKAPPKSFDELIDEKSSIFTNLRESVRSEFTMAQAIWGRFRGDPFFAVVANPFRVALYCFLFVVAFTLTFGVVNVLLFLCLTSRKQENKGTKGVEKMVDTKLVEGVTGKVAEKVTETVIEEEQLAKTTGNATGTKVSHTSSRKIR